MELQAALQGIHLRSPDPLQSARFYCRAYDMVLSSTDGGYVCSGPGRSVGISNGPANQLNYAHLALNTAADWEKFANRAQDWREEVMPVGLQADKEVIAVRDPDANLLLFTPPIEPGTVPANTVGRVATLQHFALRTPNMVAMLAFYTEQLGFVLSDAVKDADGALRACFLRTEALHHSLALFFAPVSCFDHQSFEAPNWGSMKTWGDHMATLQVPIVWGIGRHGPGNDVFFMVRDPDGNLAEISAEIEHCAPDRPAGTWPHEERTLNLWGKAILRS
jgi:catechol 2,3-dioxygenase